MSLTHPSHQSTRPFLQRVSMNTLLLALWLWLYAPVFDYLALIFSREDFRTNQLILIGVLFLIAIQIRKGSIRPKADALPHLYLPALTLALASSFLYLAVERFLDINTISASLFGLASYGLLGLWMAPRRWREGMPAILLLIGTLPFGEHMQTFIGYPMRILTAAIVRDGLAAAGVASMGVDTILVFENGVSQVDSPCSGVKSLWTGMLFIISATWIERRALNGRWLLITLLFAGLLFVSNLTRVGILVVVGEVIGWHIAAELLHVPLGVLGFVLACAVAVILLRTNSPTSPPLTPQFLHFAQDDITRGGTLSSPSPRGRGGWGVRADGVRTSSVSAGWFPPTLAFLILLMGLIYTPRPPTTLSDAPPVWHFPAELITEPMPLKPDEFDWLTRDGAESADRQRYEWHNITGSMILITSTTWRAHHRPERCFEVYGLKLEQTRTHLVTPDFPLRIVSLGEDKVEARYSATYWFQSLDKTTDDYATRIWADLALERERWVLVSILFDGEYDPSSPEMKAFYMALHDAVQEELKGKG